VEEILKQASAQRHRGAVLFRKAYVRIVSIVEALTTTTYYYTTAQMNGRFKYKDEDENWKREGKEVTPSYGNPITWNTQRRRRHRGVVKSNCEKLQRTQSINGRQDGDGDYDNHDHD